jgi:hypothetical protein
VVGDHGDVAVAIGPSDRNAQPGQLGEQHWRRMPVVVVSADADYRHAGMPGGQEAGIGVRRPVVRHLQNVGPQVGAGCQQCLLRLDLRVAGQQDATATDARSQDQ